MKTRIVLIAVFLLFTLSPCFASVVIESVSKNRAEKDFGITVRTKIVSTNEIGVWLEFAPKGKLDGFSYAQLGNTSERKIASKTLTPLKQTDEIVVIYFSTDPKIFPGATLTVFVNSNGFPPYSGYEFKIWDFVKLNASSHP